MTKENGKSTVTIIAIVLLAFVVIRSAWVCDDAYITFRTLDNFIHGYGLTWNTAERVQAYTHPLWLFAMLGPYALSHEVFYTSIALSVILTVLSVSLLAFGIARSWTGALLGITILAFSKGFIDYSTSGLENPLTHLILALFLFVYFKYEINTRTVFLLSLIASMGALNRMDTFLLFLPVLSYSVFRLKWQGLLAAILGFLPFLMWECFSLLYYGFPFPNTAYAKLNTGYDEITLALQGLYYLLNSIRVDRLTLLMIAVGVLSPLLTKRWRDLPVAIGIVLYLFYVVKIGGDFMSGRFMTAPLFCAVALLTHSYFPSLRQRWLAVFLGVVIVVGFTSPAPTLLSSANYGLGWEYEDAVDAKGVADERGYYYQECGLLNAHEGTECSNHEWAEMGRQARASGRSVIRAYSVGLLGFHAGPDVHVIDRYALADPLLARLPAQVGPGWRIGHFQRTLPSGYVATLASGKNEIRDGDLAAYYEKLSLITRGNLLDVNRLTEIWKMNLGAYNDLIDSAASSGR